MLGEGVDEQPPLGPNFRLLPLADGFGTATAFTDGEFAALCDALGLSEVAEDPRLATTAARMENFDLMTATYRDKIGPAAAQRTREEFTRELTERDVPHGVVRAIEALHEDPHVVATGVFAERDHALAGRLREPRHPARFHATPVGRPEDAPALGQHSDEILRELELGARIPALRESGVLA